MFISEFVSPPLVEAAALPLPAGGVRLSQASRAGEVFAALQKHLDSPSAWEGGTRLAFLLLEEPASAPFCLRVEAEAQRQAEDGSWPMAFPDALALARSCMALAHLKQDAAMVRRVGQWLAYVGYHIEEIAGAHAGRLADLWDLLEDYYRLTGKKAVLQLCEKLREGGMDWTSALHTFSLQRGMAGEVSFVDLQTGMASADADRAARFRRMSLLGRAESLADGMRAARLSGMFSGNAMELSAARAGWEKISRWHGAVCGGTTADEWLAGRAPGRAISAGSLGAWAEAFALCLTEKDSAWAAEALDVLIANALSATDGRMQRVNQPRESIDNCYGLISDEAEGLGRLARAWTAIAQTAVMRQPGGYRLTLLQPGAYRLGSSRLLVQRMGEDAFSWALNLTVRGSLDGIAIRIPEWCEEAEASLEGRPSLRAGGGENLHLPRFEEGTHRLRLRLTPRVHAVEGYHQSIAVYRGPDVMCMPVTDGGDWRVAAAGAPVVEESRVKLPVRNVPEWKREDDVPVRPRAQGDARLVSLTRYADCPRRLAVFPREFEG